MWAFFRIFEIMKDKNMEKVENILGKELKCLDNGFVRLVDFMGDDAAIVQAARTSYGQGTKTLSEDRSLIRYLMRNRHTSPFEMVEFKFHIKLPIFVARQWIRHRTASVNEYSGRYSEMRDEFYVPEPELIRFQSKDNKQGRDNTTLSSEFTDKIVTKISQSQKNSYAEYKEYIDEGIAREIARINLPLSIYTEWYWKIDLHNLFHFLKLRMDKHSQYEIRVYAEKIAEILKNCVPLAYEAFEDYQLNSINLSALEQKAISILIKNSNAENSLNDEKLSALGLSKTEIIEFKNKLEKIK
jgi:thymidylate synthase (FAD)